MKTVSFEVRCAACDYLQLWGLEQVTRGLVRAGKLNLKSDFDAVLVSEIFRVYCSAIPCPKCGEVGTLTQNVPPKNKWTWADEIRCEDCDQEIPPKRLAAIPGVTRCITCQTLVEQK